MDPVGRFRKLAVKRGLTPGAMREASPEDFDLLLFALRREFRSAASFTEREVNDRLKTWLETAGGMLDTDHVELRRWLIDLNILARDAYGQAYSLAALPHRLRDLDGALADVDFARELVDANAQESQKRAARKAAWQQGKAVA